MNLTRDQLAELAEAIAREEVLSVRHNMALSGKPTSEEATRRLIEKRVRELLTGDLDELLRDDWQSR